MQNETTTSAPDGANEISAYNAMHACENEVGIDDLCATLFEIDSLIRAIQCIATSVQSSTILDPSQGVSDIRILAGMAEMCVDSLSYGLGEVARQKAVRHE